MLIFSRLWPINSDDSEDIYQKARIYYFLGDYDDAKTELNKMADSMDERSTMLLCRTYMKQDDTAHARQLYQQYMDKYGETSEAYNGMVLCDITDENYDSALENITKGLALSNDKGKQDLYFNEIVVYERSWICDRKRKSSRICEKLSCGRGGYPGK